MKDIKLYGWLGKKYGKRHRYAVETPAQAIQLLCANYKGLDKEIADWQGAGFRIVTGKSDISEAELFNSTGAEYIKIIPMVQGAGGDSGAIFQIVAGAALIYATGGFGGEALLVGMPATIASNFGMALLLGGVSQMLFSPPAPIQQTAGAQNPSFGFDGAINTSRQGLPIPVGYGTVLVGGAVISAGMNSVNVPI